MSTSLMKSIARDLDWFQISDEEKVGHPEIYFRIVRPRPAVDVGPLHADQWFWDLGHGTMPERDKPLQRIKFWFSLYNNEGDTGFRYVPGSHLKDYPYKGELRHGIMKPVFDEKDHDLDIQHLQGSAGTFIIFHDSLLHGGYPTEASSRVSFEFTLIVEAVARSGL